MRAALVAAAVLLAAAGARQPAIIYVGAPDAHARVYGPADMLCDLNKCRLFNLPREPSLPPRAIAEFGIPVMSGQDRVELRRCLEQVCRASVLGTQSERTSLPGHSNPTLFITPIELRLE